MKMVSDDPKFVFANGQVGTYTKTYKLRPMQGETDNIYIGSPTFGKPEWPVAPMTNFTGSVEFSSSKPFYYYFLRETEVGEAADATDAYFAGWRPWRDDVPAAWDDDLKQFVIPYTNYWHNEKSWPIGWHSVLTLKNETDQPVTYTLKHIPYYGGQFNPKNGQITRYKEQVVQVVLQKGEEKKATLQDLFGWATDQMSSMEGCLARWAEPQLSQDADHPAPFNSPTNRANDSTMPSGKYEPGLNASGRKAVSPLQGCLNEDRRVADWPTVPLARLCPCGWKRVLSVRGLL